MAVKTKQQLKEETLKELEAEEKKLKEAEEKKQQTAAAQAKANKEADLIGAKDAEKLSSGSKTTTSSASAADKAKNSSVTKNATATEAKQTVSNSTAKRAGAAEGVQKVETAKTEKATARAKANKEADLIGYDGHAAQKAYEHQIDQEKIEYLNIKESRDKKTALEQELENLKAQAKGQAKGQGTAATVSSALNPRKGANTSVIDPELQSRIDALEKEINDLNKNINLASGIQNKKYLYNSAANAKDFEEYSHDPQKEKEEKGYNVYKKANQGRETETVKGYMTEEERAVYNYYYNKFGEEKAEEYFKSIRSDLNQRQAEAMFAGNEGKILNEYIIGAAAGLESSKEGYQGALRMLLGDDSIQPTGTYNYLSQMAREDLADTGAKLPEAIGGASLGQLGFDVVNTTANMLPSIALGTLGGGAVGAAAIGASAGGNAYNNAIAEGYSKDQATNYAVLVGASEAGLGYVLGGIEATGGKISGAALGKVLPKIDNALAKAAVNVSGKMASEFSEEYLQEVLTPVFENIALKEDNEINLISEEAIYAGILGALSAGGIALIDGSANVPEAAVKTEAPVPFNGTAQPGTEAALVADKIAEIESRPVSEAKKAAAMEKVAQAVAQNGTEQGLIEEVEKSKNYHAERAAEFDEAVAIGKKLGVTVEFDPNIAGNGVHTSDGRIIINPNTKNPARQVFVHELTHDIETSGFYGEFSNKILGHITEQGYDLQKIREQVKADYEAEGHNLTNAQIDAEVVAKYVERHLFTDDKAIQRLLDTDPGIFQRIKNWISDMIVKFSGSPEEKFLRNAEKLYAKALATRGEISGIRTEQASIVNIPGKGQGVYLDTDLYNGLSDAERKEMLKARVKELGGQILTAFDKNGNAVNFKIVTSQRFINSNGKAKPANNDLGTKFAGNKTKQEATDLIDELVLTSSFDGTEPAKHSHDWIDNNGQNNWEKWKTYLIDKNNTAWEARLNIANSANGEKILYDIDPIKKVGQAGNSATSSPDQRIPQKSPVVNDQHSVGRGFDEMANAVSPEEKQQHIEDAKNYFGTTVNWKEAGYILPDGRRLDFSGRHEGGPGGYRSVDHRDIIDALGSDYGGGSYSGGMIRFMGEGNIRISPESAGINLSVEPTKDQYYSLGDFISRNRGEVILDIDDINGNTISSKEYPKGTYYSKIIADIKNYFENGILPQGSESETAQWRYSTGQSFDEMAAEAKTPSMERADAQLNADDWKGIAESINPETGIWRMKDFARVLDSAAGGNKVLRQQLYDLYEKPLNKAQGEYAKNYGEKAKQISDKFKELGIKTGSKESAAVQRIGEGVKEINKNGDTEPYTLEDLKRDFPDSWQNIKEGADYCRTVYDKFLNDLNTMYSEIYPATVEQANEKISGYDTRISAYNTKIENIRTVVENLETLRAEKQAELAKKKQTTLIYGEIQNQIVNIDQRIEKAGRIIERLNNRKFTKEIARDTLKAQVENGEILKNKQIRPRKDYFRHFQELTNEFAEIADIFSNDQRIPPDLAGKSETTKPRTIWTSLAQQRGKNYYTEDAVGGLLRYTEIAEKLLAYDPLISHFRDVNSAIRAAGTMVENEVKGKGTNAGQFAAWADDITNQLAGKTNAIDRFITDRTGALGRATIKSIEALNRRVKSNAILGNFRSALVQIGNIPTANLYISNPIDWAKGVVSTAGSVFGSSQEISEARKHSNFMNRRYMGDTINELTKEIQSNNILNKPKEFAIWMLGAGDRAAAELIWHTAYTKAVQNPQTLTAEENRRNYESAIDYADDITRRSIAGRAEGDIPYFEESKLTGLVAPFQIEVANTFNAFTEQLGEKNAAGILAFEVSVFLMNAVLEAMTGDRPLGLDFVDVALDLVKEAIGDEEDEEEKDLWEFIKKAGGRIGGEILSSMPFGTQIGSFLTGGDEQKAEDWFGDTDPTRYGTGNIGMGALADALDYFISGENPEKFFNLVTDGQKNSYKEWAAPIVETAETFAPLLMPWGGKQAARTLGGLDQIIQGGAYGEKNGEEYLKYLQGDEPGDIAKTLLFGKYGGSTAQEYIDSGFKGTLSSEQTKQMELAEQYGISNEDFYDVVLGLKDYSKKADKQEALFNNPDLSAKEKDVLDYILFGDANSKAAENGYVEPGRAYSSEEAFYRSGISDSENRLLDAGYSREDAKAIEKAISTGKNKEEKVAEISKALGCSEEEALEAYYKKEGRWVSDRKDLSKDEISNLDKMAEMYEVDDKGYFAARNAILTSDGEKDEYGNTISGSTKKEAIENIRKELGCSKEEATIYYLAANGDLVLSVDDLTSSHREDLEIAIKHGWTERQYIDAVNLIKVSGATKKADIIKTLTDAGASYEMAQGYYNLRENKDYDRKVS